MEQIKNIRECIKRSAENSPDIQNKKRLVFCDLTNTVNKTSVPNVKGGKKDTIVIKANADTEENTREVVDDVFLPSENSEGKDAEETFYESALDKTVLDAEQSTCEAISQYIISLKPLPPGLEDFDEKNIKDIHSESRYVPYIFEYYRSREKMFKLEKYMHRQPEINSNMRAVLIDWMVEVQESFELNHETLYLAVKLVDFYLMKNIITKANLQLVGATAILVACKYDERMPPLLDDFLYICDDSYTRSELIAMETKILKGMDFQLGVPLSYRFLRRYARCTRTSMEVLTLARYILETSLMDYELIDVADSQIAAAVFYLAMQMKSLGDWNKALEYYTGYRAEELDDLVKRLNKGIAVMPNRNLTTIHTKYSHPIFFEVTKIPPLPVEKC